jgi:hypothetical protein
MMADSDVWVECRQTNGSANFLALEFQNYQIINGTVEDKPNTDALI